MKQCFLFIILIPVIISAQDHQLFFESLSPEKGFSAPLIRGVLQDKEGYLWFGALNGLYRYDGFTLKPYVYRPEHGATITKGYVNVIYEDSRNNFWVGTSSGLNRLDRSTGDFEQFIPDSSGYTLNNYIWSLFEDSKGVLWVGTMGLYTRDDKSGKLKPMVFPKGMEKLNNISFQSIAEDKNGTLWFGTTIGLFKFDRNLNLFIPVLIDPDEHKLTEKNWNTGNYSMPCMHKDNSGIIWIGTYGGRILKLDPVKESITDYMLTDPITSKPVAIQSIAEENEEQFWLGTFSGLILFERRSGKILAHYKYKENAEKGLTDDQIISVLKDKSGTLWAATLMGGLNRVNRTTFPFNKIVKEGLMKDKSHSLVPYNDFYVSRSGSLFFGTYECVIEIKPDLKTTLRHPPFKPVNVIMEDSRGNQWIGLKQIGGGGILLKDQAGKLHTILDSLGEPFVKEVHCLYESSKGNIYFGTESYLFEIDPDKMSCNLIFQAKSRIYSFGEDPDGNLLIGTLLGGLLTFDQEMKVLLRSFTSIETDRTSLIDNSILGIYEDKKQRIWILSTVGFCLFDPAAGTFKRFHNEQEMEHAAVMCVTEDDEGRLWFGTTNGITMFDPEKEIIRNYDQDYGMAEGYHYAAGKADGKIFIKAKPGVTYFAPEEVMDNPFIPPVKITELRVFDKIYPAGKEVVLAYEENYISFEFAALSFISPERNLYAYKMEGIDKDWVYPKGRRYAAYTSLKPGRYSFKVKASNNDGVWNERETVLSIIILPPWWQTYWAYTFYLLAVLLLVYGWRRYDLKRQNLKYQLQTEQEYSEKQKELSEMKSRFFTNISHEFRTPLTLIIGPADEIISGKSGESVKHASMIKKNALRLLRLINQLLDISKLDEKKFNLQASYGDLVVFVRGMVMIFESFAETKDITLTVKAGKESIFGYFDKEKLEKILINIISNAFKFTPEGGKIDVSLSESNGVSIIKIKDTGIGISENELPKLFDRFYQVDNSQTREYGGTGIGLSLTRELIELHKGEISVESRQGEWTEFTVRLPIDRNSFRNDEVVEPEEVNFITSRGTDLNIQEQVQFSTGEPLLADPHIPGHLPAAGDNEEKMVILIVEDNADVREYIKDILGTEFIIEEASNGEQAVRKAEKIIPDLIVSDVMMPKMDGYQMTRILKNNEKTNHIPIILLTAKTERGSKFEGLETGADDYLTKPFDNIELQIRIRNLINMRRTLQEKFSGKIKVSLIEAVKKLNPLDANFINRINEVLTIKMADEKFSIEEFSEEMGMSRIQMHRKLKAITGKNSSRYLRSFRLSAAKSMIEEQKGNISEIAYSVGFSSPVYFSKCFKDEFGYTPSDLKQV
jgi:signal transduction histidine kinase/DNA-binding response OmpR family regulator/streptogramin lyase